MRTFLCCFANSDAAPQVRRVAGELTGVRGSVVGVLTTIPSSNTEDVLIWKGG